MNQEVVSGAIVGVIFLIAFVFTITQVRGCTEASQVRMLECLKIKPEIECRNKFGDSR